MPSRYFINKVFIIAFSFFLLGNSVFASPTWYGKIFVDAQSFSNDVMGTKTDIKNNSSRLGLKGEYSFSENSNHRFSLKYSTNNKIRYKIDKEIHRFSDNIFYKNGISVFCSVRWNRIGKFRIALFR